MAENEEDVSMDGQESMGQDDIEKMLEEMEQAKEDAAAAGEGAIDADAGDESLPEPDNQEAVNVDQVQLDSFFPGGADVSATNLELLLNIGLSVSIELGRTEMLIKDVLKLGVGSIVELNKVAGEHIDLLVNNKRFAEGEVVVIDENFGIRITKLLKTSSDSSKGSTARR